MDFSARYRIAPDWLLACEGKDVDWMPCLAGTSPPAVCLDKKRRLRSGGGISCLQGAKNGKTMCKERADAESNRKTPLYGPEMPL